MEYSKGVTLECCGYYIKTDIEDTQKRYVMFMAMDDNGNYAFRKRLCREFRSFSKLEVAAFIHYVLVYGYELYQYKVIPHTGCITLDKDYGKHNVNVTILQCRIGTFPGHIIFPLEDTLRHRCTATGLNFDRFLNWIEHIFTAKPICDTKSSELETGTIHCICGSTMILSDITALYKEQGVTCDICSEDIADCCWHCEEKSKPIHPDGYDVCQNCIEKNNNLCNKPYVVSDYVWRGMKEDFYTACFTQRSRKRKILSINKQCKRLHQDAIDAACKMPWKHEMGDSDFKLFGPATEKKLLYEKYGYTENESKLIVLCGVIINDVLRNIIPNFPTCGLVFNTMDIMINGYPQYDKHIDFGMDHIQENKIGNGYVQYAALIQLKCKHKKGNVLMKGKQWHSLGEYMLQEMDCLVIYNEAASTIPHGFKNESDEPYILMTLRAVRDN